MPGIPKEEHPLVNELNHLFNPDKRKIEMPEKPVIERMAKSIGKKPFKTQNILQGVIVDFSEDILALKIKIKWIQKRLRKLTRGKAKLNTREIEKVKIFAEAIDATEIKLNKIFIKIFKKFGLALPAKRRPDTFSELIKARRKKLEKTLEEVRKPVRRTRFGVMFKKSKKPSGDKRRRR